MYAWYKELLMEKKKIHYYVNYLLYILPKTFQYSKNKFGIYYV